MKKNVFFVGMLALVLVFGMAVVGCDDGTTTNNTEDSLPEASGTNELGGKTYTGSEGKVVFSSSGTTYQYYEKEEGDDWKEEHNGNYSWNSSVTPKTVTLAPQKVRAGDALYDKAGWKVDFRNTAPEGITDAAISEMTSGKYTTITAYVNARADETFALQLYTYAVSGEEITTFEEVGE
jgi:hypothetical protein